MDACTAPAKDRIADPSALLRGCGQNSLFARGVGPFVGLVREIGAYPALRFGEGTALAGSVGLDLVAADPPDREVPRLRVVEVDPGYGSRGRDGERLGEDKAVRLRAEEREQLRLLGVVGAGRVPEGRTNPAVPLRDQLVVRAARA